MVKVRSNVTFKGVKENSMFEQNEEYEVTIERMDEINNTLSKKGVTEALTRIDKPKKEEAKEEVKKPVDDKKTDNKKAKDKEAK